MTTHPRLLCVCVRQTNPSEKCKQLGRFLKDFVDVLERQVEIPACEQSITHTIAGVTILVFRK
jgi:hypothetical protein